MHLASRSRRAAGPSAPYRRRARCADGKSRAFARAVMVTGVVGLNATRRSRHVVDRLGALKNRCATSAKTGISDADGGCRCPAGVPMNPTCERSRLRHFLKRLRTRRLLSASTQGACFRTVLSKVQLVMPHFAGSFDQLGVCFVRSSTSIRGKQAVSGRSTVTVAEYRTVGSAPFWSWEGYD